MAYPFGDYCWIWSIGRSEKSTEEAGFGFENFMEENLVEPDGIEPTTSCLQSTRSPN